MLSPSFRGKVINLEEIGGFIYVEEGIVKYLSELEKNKNNMENEQISEAALSLKKYSTVIDMIIEKGYVKHRSHIAAVHPIGNGSYEFSLVFNVNIQCKREYAGDILKKIVQDVFDSEGHVKIIIEKKDNTITVSRASDGMVYKNIELV